MTVNTEIARIAHDGDGASQTFAVQFYFLQDRDLTVYVGSVKQTLTTDYTVGGAGNPSGGSVTFGTAPPAGSGNVVVIRDPDQLQSTKYPANDPFPAKTHETALDKLTMLVQRTRDLIGRSFTLSDADSSGASLTIPTPSASTLIGWNPGGTALQNVDANTLATTIAFGTAHADIFSGTGAKTAFTLSANPGAQANLDVSVNGVTQRPGLDFTWTTGTTLTFASAPGAGTNNVLARYVQAIPATGALQIASNLSDLANAVVARANLGLASGAVTTVGTAASKDAGTAAGNLVQLDGSGKLPAIDGSQLANLPNTSDFLLAARGII